eukprot:2691910-Alexandrium_andersonii.AAC.1
MQIGRSGMQSVLQGFVCNLASQKRCGVLVVDLNMHTGDLCKAFTGFLKTNSLLYYLGFNHSGNDWAHHHMVDFLSEKLLDGSLMLPGLALPGVDPPPELLAGEPERPRLTTL